MKKLKRGMWILLAVLAPFPAAQAGPENQPLVGIYVKDGLLLVHNVSGAVFTLKIKGQELKASNIPNGVAFSFGEGKIVTFSTMSFSQFAVRKKASIKQRMAEYKASRMAYLAKLVPNAPPASKTKHIKHKGRLIALWHVDLPSNSGGAKPAMIRQLHAVIVVNKTVVVLGAPVLIKGSESAMRKYLIATAKSLRPYAKPINVKALRAKLMKQ